MRERKVFERRNTTEGLLSNLFVLQLQIPHNISVRCWINLSLATKEGRTSKWGTQNRIMSQSKGAINGRRYLNEFPQIRKKNSLNHKKNMRRKRAFDLLETCTLRPELKDRRDEFVEEYAACSDLGEVMSKWLLEDS